MQRCKDSSLFSLCFWNNNISFTFIAHSASPFWVDSVRHVYSDKHRDQNNDIELAENYFQIAQRRALSVGELTGQVPLIRLSVCLEIFWSCCCGLVKYPFINLDPI
ncbi:MAG: hypothetical protein DRR06_04890 [Gammaproteobacteria bacterium]|nr:MAG: hypothetical protein DRR06_04890 [Gammaproteobacteria bacterium]RLA46802.1 MAG: hypothetical protein DRR42_18105 [Gammaproteobacteria bacterium]